LLGQPGLLVLDEPTAGLDGPAVERLVATLTARLATGTAIVLADHGELSDALPADVDLDLGGGPARADSVRIDLRGTGTLRDTAAADGRLVLDVPAPEADALLLEALSAGWSVARVGPSRAPGR
jgi:hypothetical protein